MGTYIEFLWSPTPEGALARQQTIGFVLDGGSGHQVCVAVLDERPDVERLQIEIVDASGAVVSSRAFDDFRGPKRCYAAGLDRSGAAGTWRFDITLDGVPAGSGTIEVADSLGSAPFHAPSSTPYVLGRPNYDPQIPPDEFVGRLVWVMHVDETGAVVDVEVEDAQGVGVLMRDRAIAAGYLSLFPPDPARAEAPLAYRRELVFATD